jgi:hypothetical protein
MDEEDLNEEDEEEPNRQEIDIVDENVENIPSTTKKHKLLSLRRPNDTRWSSSLLAAERILQLKPFIIKVATRYCKKIIEEDEKKNLWNKLHVLTNMLDPFRKATDVLQSDSSTLYTVYLEFAKVLLTIQKFPVDIVQVDVKAVKEIIISYWKKHININAVIMSAKLSFDSCYEHIFDSHDESVLTKSKDWFMDFGVKYLMYYRKQNDTRTRDEIYLKLMKQYGDLLLMSPPFSKYSKFINNIKEGIKSKETESQVDAMQLWGFVGDEVPELAQCAIAILTLPASEAAVERSFSQQGTVHRPVRNRMSSKLIECEMRIKFNSKIRTEKASKSNLFNEQLDADAVCEYNETGAKLFELDEEITNEIAHMHVEEELELLSENEISSLSKRRHGKASSITTASPKTSSNPVDVEDASSSPLLKRQKVAKVSGAIERPKITRVSERAEKVIPYDDINNLNDFVASYVKERQLTSIPHWTSNTNTHLDSALACWPVKIKDCTEEVRKKIAAYIRTQQLQQQTVLEEEATLPLSLHQELPPDVPPNPCI